MLVRAMPRKECPPNIAVCEGFFGRLPVGGSDRQLRGAKITAVNDSSGRDHQFAVDAHSGHRVCRGLNDRSSAR